MNAETKKIIKKDYDIDAIRAKIAAIIISKAQILHSESDKINIDKKFIT